MFIPHANKIAELYPHFKTDGLKKVYSKILSNYVNYLSDKNKSSLIEVCFDYLLSDKKAVAIRGNCIQLLYKLSIEIPEIKQELNHVLELNLKNTSGGLIARAKMILKDISKLEIQ